MNRKLRRTVGNGLARTGVLRAWRRATRGQLSRLLLIGHHRVLPLPDERAFRGDVELVSATPEEFAWQIEFLARHFEPVSCRQIAAALDGTASLPRDAVAVTFDDGFADLADYAVPILQKAKVPATIFVPTDYVESGKPFWFDLVARVFSLAEPHSIAIAPMKEALPRDGTAAARADAAYWVLKLLKYCDDAVRLAFLAQLQARHADLVAAASDGLGRAFDWDGLRAVMAAGIEIGGHSASHPSLSCLGAEALWREVDEPRRKIEAQLGMPCVSFAYPFGGPRSFSPAVEDAVRKSGYRVGVSYIHGVNPRDETRRYSLRRQHVERYTTREDFESIVTLPEFFS